MSTSTLSLFLRHLALSEEVSRLGSASDHDLLAASEPGHGQAAFAELMRRHGPMVLRTCRRVLGRGPDAEDAFQATFVLLARKATQLRREAAGRKSLGGWLHRVAYQTALDVLNGTIRRRIHERQAGAMIHSDLDPFAEATWNEIRPILDAELNALPDQARRLLIACYLEGKTHVEAAAELGLPPGSMAWRLEQARAILATRLARRGVTVSATLLAALLGELASGAGVPAVLLVHTLEVATTFSELASEVMSAHVAKLVKGILMSMTKSSTKLSIVLVCCLGLAGTALVACRALSARPDQPAAAGPVVPQAAERPGQDGAKQAGTDLYGDPLPPGALARMGTVRFRHHFLGVRSVCFSPDGKILASGGEGRKSRLHPSSHGGDVHLWEAATGKEIGVCQGPIHPVQSVCFSPDGKTLASGGWDGSVRLWDVVTRKQIRMCLAYPERGEWTNDYFVSSVCFSPDGKLLASGGNDKVVRMWDVATGKEIRKWQEGERGGTCFTIVAFSPDGKTLASVWTEGATVRLSDVATGKQIRIWKAVRDEPKEKYKVHSVAFSPDGKTLASAGTEGIVRLWDVATGKQIRSSMQGHSPVCFSPDGKTLASGKGAGYVFWDVASGKQICVWKEAGGNAVSFSPDGKRVASGGNFGPVRLFEVATGKEVLTAQGHQSYVHCLSFSPDGKTLASGGRDHTARLWDVATSKQISVCQEELPQGGAAWAGMEIGPVAFSPDGKTLASVTSGIAGKRSPVRLWEVATGRVLRNCERAEGGYSAGPMSFSPDGKTLALGRCVDATPSYLWEVATGKLIRSKPASGGAISPDGKILASMTRQDEQAVQLCAADTGKVIHVCKRDKPHIITVLCFSPDNKILVSAECNGCASASLRLWEVATGKQIRYYPIIPYEEIRGYSGYLISCLCFSPDGRVLAVGGPDGPVRLFEMATGKRIRLWQGHQGPVTSLSFSPDGKTLASASDDTTVLLWKVPTATRLVEKELSPQAVQQQWTALAGQDADRAYQAISALSAAPRQALSLFQEHLRPIPPLSAEEKKRIAQFIEDLDNDQFVIRQKATKELEKIIDKENILPALRQALRGQMTLEKRRRLEELIERAMQYDPLPMEVLRALRSLQVLEQIGTSEAQQVLKKLAGGNPGSRLTQEAQASLKRLTH